jgi:integrase
MPSITKRFVDAATPGRHYDDRLAGFGLYVGAGGTRSYFFEYRPGRGRSVQKRRISIGKHGAPWTPQSARERALQYLAMVKDGRDPLAERDAAERGHDSSRLLSAVVEEWLKRDQAKNRSLREVARIMRREVLPIWGDRPIEDIRKRDIIVLIDGIADRGAKIMANRTLAHIKRLFRWAAGRDIIDSDPAAHVEKTAPETKRERVLTDDELADVWRGAEAIGYPFGPALQLLTLTGARREEIFGLRWCEIDLEGAAIRLPAERSKMKEGRAIPLSPFALALLSSLPRFVGGDQVFGLDGYRPFANIGHAKARLDRLLAATRGQALPAWRIHDLRRSTATGLQRLGARLEVIEAVLGHVSGSRGGIVGLYQRHRFEEEARAALVAWGEHVARLLSPHHGAAVVPLVRRG